MCEDVFGLDGGFGWRWNLGEGGLDFDVRIFWISVADLNTTYHHLRGYIEES